ncbi:hypothetical protein BJ166DRAFT_356594 [Pestalotiopsis sp. NC0098]|nr:hypothetical protein BJ166DRAFT_356594 [Pestalotiopsis sp. NC0098]
MATSFSPRPSFHLCPDFSIAPPPDGHLELGSVLRGLDFDGVFSPLNIGDSIPVPDSHLRPLNGPAEKAGFSRSLKELRGLEGSVWATVFGSQGLGAAFSFLRNRKDDETLTVEKLFVRYFIPTTEYIKTTLETDGIALYINSTKREKPVYLITGLMWTEGAKLSKIQSKKSKSTGQVAATDPNSGTTVGVKGAYENDESFSSSFDGSTPFILGIRVRKFWWDKSGIRQSAEDIVGATLGGSGSNDKDLLDGIHSIDDEIDRTAFETIVNESHAGIEGAVTWILP